jgi:TPR repeat protein
MADVFISYSRADRDRAQQLARALQARGIDVWWDPELLPGEEYSKKIAGVLAKAKAIIVIWSRASVESNWVMDEAAVGSKRSNLVPVLFDAVEPPLGFRQNQAEDLSRWPEPEGAPAFERVVAAIERLRGQTAVDASERIRRASRMRAINRFGVAAASIAAIGVAAVVVTQVLNREPGKAAGPEEQQQASTNGDTDSPGPAELYGFARAELDMFAPQELIRVALQRTTLEAVEAGANAGDPLGRTLSCLSKAYGEGLPAPDPQGARDACQTAANAGEGLALYQLSLMARSGAGAAPDAAQADQLLDQAVGAGDPRAQFDRARALIDSGANDAEAARLARLAVDKGYPPATVLYGWMLENGRGVAADPGMAFSLYQRAGETGSPEGLRASARMLEDGVGVNQDYAQARNRYALASRLGDGQSSMRLARLYELGRGGAIDLTAAERFYRLAVQQGVSEAQAEADRLSARQ